MASIDRPHIGHRIAARRRARHMTQADLSRVSGVSLAMIRGIERGVRTPSDRTLDVLADTLGIDRSRLVTVGPARMSERVRAALPALSVSIAGYDLGAEGRRGRPLDVLTAEVAVAEGRRLAAQYSCLATGAPDLVADLLHAVHTADAEGRVRAVRLLVRASRSADAVAVQGGFPRPVRAAH